MPTGSLGDFAVATKIFTKFSVVDSTGVLTALASGSVAVFVNNSAAGTIGGVSLQALTIPGVTANAIWTVVVDTAADGLYYATTSQYTIVLTAGTILAGAYSLAGYVIDQFSLEATAALRPTVAGRTLDVTATGAAGVDWANVEGQSTANNLSGTNIDVDQVVASVSGAVGSVTGAVGSVTGNVGGNVVGSVASVTGAVGSVTGNVGGNVTGSVGSVLAGVTVTTNSDKTGYALSQAGSEAIWDVTKFVEPSGVFAWASVTPRLILQWLGVMNTNKITQTATTQLMRNRADSGTVGTSTVSDDGTTFTKGSVT